MSTAQHRNRLFRLWFCDDDFDFNFCFYENSPLLLLSFGANAIVAARADSLGGGGGGGVWWKSDGLTNLLGGVPVSIDLALYCSFFFVVPILNESIRGGTLQVFLVVLIFLDRLQYSVPCAGELGSWSSSTSSSSSLSNLTGCVVGRSTSFCFCFFVSEMVLPYRTSWHQKWCGCILDCSIVVLLYWEFT